jgi:hypothetical protein
VHPRALEHGIRHHVLYGGSLPPGYSWQSSPLIFALRARRLRARVIFEGRVYRTSAFGPALIGPAGTDVAQGRLLNFNDLVLLMYNNILLPNFNVNGWIDDGGGGTYLYITRNICTNGKMRLWHTGWRNMDSSRSKSL